MAECAITHISIITGVNLVSVSMALLTSIRITSEICLLTATLVDNRLMYCYQIIRQITEKLLLKVACSFLMARRGIYSPCAYLVSKSHNQNTNSSETHVM